MVPFSARWSDSEPTGAVRMRWNEAVSKRFGVGAYAYQRLSLMAKRKAHRRETKASNRTWEIRPSGIIGGPRKPWHGGIANPPRNRKGESGNPPSSANASEFYPNHWPNGDSSLVPSGGAAWFVVFTLAILSPELFDEIEWMHVIGFHNSLARSVMAISCAIPLFRTSLFQTGQKG